jgi:hypothetical protein
MTISMIGPSSCGLRDQTLSRKCASTWSAIISPTFSNPTNKPQHPTFRPPRLTIRKPPYEVRRLGWGAFTLEAEIVLKEPYSWNVNNGGAKQPGLELTWTLDFHGRGRQGRVRTKVRKFQEAPIAAGRALRPRPPPVTVSHTDDEDDEDDDYAEGEDGDGDTSSDEDEVDEEVSEFIGTS